MLEYVVLVGMIIVFIIVFYGIIVVHDIPYEIAVHRNHPHQDAIHVAGWISLIFYGRHLAFPVDLGNLVSRGPRLGNGRE